MHLKLSRVIKISVNVIMSILLVVSSYTTINLNGQNTEINTANSTLNATIMNQEDIINGLTENNEMLNASITQMQSENEKLQEDQNVLEARIQELLAQIERDNETVTIESTKRDFKTYMSYKAITSTSSRQWQLQQEATTDEDGIRRLNGIPMVAIGTGWGLKVGDVGLVVCENGNSFKVVVGDIKSNAHTDEENKTTVASGCRCEFIVDIPELDNYVKVTGNVANMSKYKGYVVSIVKVK